MKKALVLLALIIVSCDNKTEQLLGIWTVDSKFYRAKYEVLKENDSLKALILYYNDDTTVLRHDPKNPQYFFSNLKKKKEVFVDAISGATKQEKQSLSIEQTHLDTLEVTTYILNKPLKETWIRTH